MSLERASRHPTRERGSPEPLVRLPGNELLVFLKEGTAARVPTGAEWAALGLSAEEPQAAGALNGQRRLGRADRR